LEGTEAKTCAVPKNAFAGYMKNELGDVKTHYMPLVASAKTEVEKCRCNMQVLTI